MHKFGFLWSPASRRRRSWASVCAAELRRTPRAVFQEEEEDDFLASLSPGAGRLLRRKSSELSVPAEREEDQKLIYAGKLLLDHHYLRQLLPEHGELHALHLVYNFKTPANKQETNAEVKANQPKLSSEVSQEPSVSSSDGERLRCSSGGQSSAEASNRLETTRHPFQNVAPGFSAYTTYSMLQMSWFQQMYARQYYMQYLASTAASADPSHAQRSQEIPVAPVTPPAPLPDPFPAQNQPENQNAAAQVNAVANQNLQMNAQGRPLMEEEEEGGHRDWLDWLYSATLFYVFVNIIYFYSSVSRFLLVMGGTVLMYLHHVGWLPFRRRPVQPFPGNVPPQAPVNQDQNNNLQAGNAGRVDESEASPGEGQVLQELQQTNPSLMSTAWIFFKTFFASLLPEGPGVTRN
ncbi:PREDICTED: homocysteine-responsive endoplasmic reticulum-resident ubiquitin-like domain member 1 protein [Chlamydotis macqueenii]|uniref:homocysteine-responsive endoplasmic reticulum-resident ubiquitin-like domain member 1 protein n=1 Tax=Chlamydotis macqueenii TaxID=187382 RepID=UPI0005296E09|nr:PREDICTED: homocysteine-responsive endoplasmic reticulum-resident ubiquitin-like domain member 1 protein [Chlamydotis macqueenii]